jgi:hypothetical protein
MKTSLQLEFLPIHENRSRWTWCLGLLMYGSVCLLPTNASAQLQSTTAQPSWIPYLEAGFDAGDEISGASVTSSTGLNSSGTNSFEHARLRFAVGVLTPSWTSLPGRPRLFIQGGIDAHSSGSERVLDVGQIGDPELAISRLPVNLPNPRPNPADTETESIAGQGRFIRQEYMGPAWAASLGVSFETPAPWEDGSIRLKPLIAYEGERFRIEGRLTEVIQPMTNVFLVRRSYARNNPTTDHRLGVGGEIELIITQGDQIELSAFGNVRYMWVVSGRTTVLGDPDGVARYRWSQDANVVRGGMGIRIGWRGFGR